MWIQSCGISYWNLPPSLWLVPCLSTTVTFSVMLKQWRHTPKMHGGFSIVHSQTHTHLKGTCSTPPPSTKTWIFDLSYHTGGIKPDMVKQRQDLSDIVRTALRQSRFFIIIHVWLFISLLMGGGEVISCKSLIFERHHTYPCIALRRLLIFFWAWSLT